MARPRKTDFDRVWEFARGPLGFAGDIFVDEDGRGFGEDGDHLDHYNFKTRAVYVSRRWETGKLKARHDLTYHFLHELAHADQHARGVYAPLWRSNPSRATLARLSLRMERDAARAAVRWARRIGVDVGHWAREIDGGGDTAYPRGYLYRTLGIPGRGE